jgi:hypothetical protein
VKEGLLPLLLEAKTLNGHRYWTECLNDLKLGGSVENFISFPKSYHSFHLKLWSSSGVCPKFDFEIGVADLEIREKFWSLERSFGVFLEFQMKIWS